MQMGRWRTIPASRRENIEMWTSGAQLDLVAVSVVLYCVTVMGNFRTKTAMHVRKWMWVEILLNPCSPNVYCVSCFTDNSRERQRGF